MPMKMFSLDKTYIPTHVKLITGLFANLFRIVRIVLIFVDVITICVILLKTSFNINRG